MHFRRLHGTKGYFWTAFLNGFILVIASLLKLQSCLIYGLSELEGGRVQVQVIDVWLGLDFGGGKSHCLYGTNLNVSNNATVSVSYVAKILSQIL